MLCYKEEVLNNAPHTWVWSDAARYVNMAGYEYISLCIQAEKMEECTEGDIIPTDENAEQADKAEAYDLLMGVSE